MSTPTARFHIDFETDTRGIDRAKAGLDELKATLERDTKALTELASAMQRLKGTVEVTRWEALPKDIAKAQSEVSKLAAQMAKLKTDFDKAPADKKEGIFARALGTQGELDRAAGRLSALKAERDKLSRTEPVLLFEDLKAGADKLKQSLGQSQTAFSRLGGTMTGEAGKAASGLKDLASGAEAAGAPVQGLKSKFEALKALGPAGIVALATVAVVALAVAFTVALVKATSFAVSMSDAARSSRLLREAAAGSASAAEGLYQATLRIEEKSSAQRDTVAGLVNEYARLKFTLGGIEGATTAVTIATQTMGSQVGSTIKSLIDRGMVAKRFWLNPLDLRGTGIAIRDVATQLAKSMKTSVSAASAALLQGVNISDGVKALGAAFEASPLGDIAKKQALAIGVQFDRAKENIGRIFSGVKIEPFLEKLSDVLGLFNETTESGKAIKEALTAAFQPLVDSATSVMPLLELAIMRGIIWVQKLVIAFHKAGGAEAVITTVKTVADDLWGTLKGIANTLDTIASTIKTVRSAYAAVEDAVTWTASNDDLAKMNTMLAIDRQLDSQGKKSSDVLTATGADMGVALAAGVAAGIKEGTPEAILAIAALADAMKSGFEKKNEIHSPSLLYRRTARNIPKGAELGVEDGTPGVARALGKMAEPPEMEASTTSSISNRHEDRSISLVVNY